MYDLMTLRAWRLSVVVILLLTLFPLTVSAQDPDPEVVETSTAEMGAPTYAEFEPLVEPPTLTEEQKAQMEWAVENTHLPGPALGEQSVEIAGPMPETESILQEERPRSGEPLLPGDAQIWQWTQFGGSIPAGNKSNVMESSIDGKARRQWFTGNWFAARSLDKGITWAFIDPYADFSTFCCDQVVIHDQARDIYLWLRMGVPGLVGGNYENEFKLSVSSRTAFQGTYWTYTMNPTAVNAAWTNEWWDYPHMQLGADYLYIAWNLFDSSDSWTRTVMLRWPLDNLAAGTSFSYNYSAQSDWFTFVPVSGAHHTMYWASNWESSPYDRLRIYRWDEDSTGVSAWTKTIAAWTPTSRNDAHCGTPNWTARLDMRVLTGARYSIYYDGIQESRQRGRKVLGWWWTVGEGGSFPYPYIDGAAFYEDTMTQLPGYLGRPYMYSSDYCFAYPSIAPNIRQDLGAVFNYSFGPNWHRPRAGYALADDYAPNAPPGWLIYGIAASNAGPSDEQWGDYNTVRAAHGPAYAWGAGVHIIPGSSDCSNCSAPVAIFFGRERDKKSWQHW